MKVFATTAITGDVSTYLPLFHSMAAQDRFRVHTLTDDPAEADVILFLDGHQHCADLSLRAIRQHPLVQTYPKRALVYSELDQPWCAMPGLYVSMPTGNFDWKRQRPCSYLSLINRFVVEKQTTTEAPSLLFSYMGRRCHPVRERILNLRHDRAHVEDTTALDFFGVASEAVLQHQRRYAAILRDSKFVLCPRGGGLASFRLFETMAAGRVPVIISDDWVPPVGPAWETMVLRVKEAEVEQVAAIVESREERFEEMSRNVQEMWKDWFAPDVTFHRMIENCAGILEGDAPSLQFWMLDRRFLYLLMRSMKWKCRKAVLERLTRRGGSRKRFASRTGEVLRSQRISEWVRPYAQ